MNAATRHSKLPAIIQIAKREAESRMDSFTATGSTDLISASEPRLLVVTSADRRFFPYVLPYIASTLRENDDCAIEIFVEADAGFERTYDSGLAFLDGQFPDRIRITEVRNQGEHPSVTRFIHAPRSRAEFVYIGDVDILHLEPILPGHLEQLELCGLPYTNMVRRDWYRRGVRRLTGLHFSRYDAYYPVAIPSDFDMSDQERGVDERLLYEMVRHRIGTPSLEWRYREMHGMHLSQSGWPHHPRMSWDLKPHRIDSSKILRATEFWHQAVPHFDRRYQLTLHMLDIAIEALDLYSPEDLAQVRTLSGPDYVKPNFK